MGDTLDCVWKIKQSAGRVILLKVIEFDLYTSINCSVDRLVIQNGEHIDSPVLATLCGPMTSLKNKHFFSNSNHIRIHLVVGGVSNVTLKGFKLGYSSNEAGNISK